MFRRLFAWIPVRKVKQLLLCFALIYLRNDVKEIMLFTSQLLVLFLMQCVNVCNSRRLIVIDILILNLVDHFLLTVSPPWKLKELVVIKDCKILKQPKTVEYVNFIYAANMNLR